MPAGEGQVLWTCDLGIPDKFSGALNTTADSGPGRQHQAALAPPHRDGLIRVDGVNRPGWLRAYPRTSLASSAPSTSFTPFFLAKARAWSVNSPATA